MQAVTLNATVREVTGKRVKKLRKEGLLPVGLYGKGIKSVALAIPMKDFLKVYQKAGETGLVELKYGSGNQHVLIKNVQIHPLSRAVLHAELYAVKLTEKIKAKVPLELVGASPAVQNNIGVLLQTLNEIEVEALPTNLPEKIEVGVSRLAEVGQQVTVGELPIPTGVEVLSDKMEIVVKVAPAVQEETAKEIAAEEAAKAAETVTEGETAAAGAEPKTEGPAESEKKE